MAAPIGSGKGGIDGTEDTPLLLSPSKRDSTDEKTKKQYAAFEEGKKATVVDYIRYEVTFSIKSAGKFVLNAFTLLFNKCWGTKKPEGFYGEESRECRPITPRTIDLKSEVDLKPLPLARALGFNKSTDEIEAEIVRVPGRVRAGRVYSGENEEDRISRGSLFPFYRELGFIERAEDIQIIPGDTLFTRAFSLDAGVSQGYSVGTHSLMVVRMFDQHLLAKFHKGDKLKGIVTANEFRFFLMLHDIGKGLAVKEEGAFGNAKRKEKELRYCQEAIQEMVEAQVIDEPLGNIFKAMLEDVTIGKLLLKKISLKEAAKELQAAKEKHKLDISTQQFFRLCMLFHMADAGAYKGLRRYKSLFEVDANTRQMRYAKNQEGYSGHTIKALKSQLDHE